MEVILLENKLIVRRLVSGILLILFSIVVFSESAQMLNISSSLGAHYSQIISTAAGSGFLLALAEGITGIIFTATCKMRPIKVVEFLIAIVDAIVIVLVRDNQYANYFKDLLIFQFIFLILYLIGAPLKKGYKNMPFRNKNENCLKFTTEKKLNELKEMLDDGTITQEEYDAKRKKILGI